MSERPQVIFLSGFSGSGKTETGKLLADSIAYGFTDTDSVVEDALGKSIPEIFAKMGESKFRFAESNAIRIATLNKPQVIALGGGSIADKNNLAYVKSMGFMVYMKVSPETIFERLKKSHFRPMLDTMAAGSDDRIEGAKERIRSLLETREKFYLEADYVIDTENKSPSEVAEAIKAKLTANE